MPKRTKPVWGTNDERFVTGEDLPRRLSKPQAVPKPRVYKTSRRQREAAKRGTEFRWMVYQRDGYKCRSCGCACREPGDFVYADYAVGHVHHLRGRNVAPEDRYNPDAAVLLCAVCHRAVHDGKLKLQA